MALTLTAGYTWTSGEVDTATKRNSAAVPTVADGQTYAFGLGSAASPSQTFNGDTNTGAYSPGADQWAVAVAGTQVVLVTTAGAAVTGTFSSSGNASFGGTTVGAGGVQVSNIKNLGFSESSTESLANSFRQNNSASYVLGSGVGYSTTANGFASTYGAGAWAHSAVAIGSGEIASYVNGSATVAIGTDVTMTKVTSTTAAGFTVYGQVTQYSATLAKTGTTLTDAAQSQVATLTNAPVGKAGNPTKWVPIDDNGTTRYIPVW